MYTVFMILLGVGGLLAMIFHLIIIINAFKTDATQGILCLCVPIYILYWAFAKFTHPKKGMILAGWFGGIVVVIVMEVMIMVFAASDMGDAMQQLQQQQLQQQQLAPGGIPGYPPPPTQ